MAKLVAALACSQQDLQRLNKECVDICNPVIQKYS